MLCCFVFVQKYIWASLLLKRYIQVFFFINESNLYLVSGRGHSHTSFDIFGQDQVFVGWDDVQGELILICQKKCECHLKKKKVSLYASSSTSVPPKAAGQLIRGTGQDFRYGAAQILDVRCIKII